MLAAGVDPSLRDDAVSAVASLGLGALPQLRRVIEMDVEGQSLVALSVLERFERLQALPVEDALLSGAGSEHVEVRNSIANSLARLSAERLTALIVRTDLSTSESKWGTLALGVGRSTIASESVLAWLDSTAVPVRVLAAGALGTRKRDARLICPLLLGHITSRGEDEIVRIECIRSLGDLACHGPGVCAVLELAVKDELVGVRQHALETASRCLCFEPKMVAFAATEIDAHDFGVRIVALRYLARSGARAADVSRSLEVHLADPSIDSYERAVTAGVLVQSGEGLEKAVPMLASLLGDADANVSSEASTGLNELPDPLADRAVRILLNAMASIDISARRSAPDGLRAIGRKSAEILAALRIAERDPDAVTREGARRARAWIER